MRALLHVAFHPLVKQLLCLLLWSGTSISLLLINRYLLHFSIFRMPWFLGVGSAGVALLSGRVLLLLLAWPDPLLQQASWRFWRSVLVLGALMGSAMGLHNAALQLLPIPAVAAVQAITPALAFAIRVLLQQQPLQVHTALSSLLVLYGAGLILWPCRTGLSTQGFFLQAAATLLDAIWYYMQCHAVQQQCQEGFEPRSQPGNSKVGGSNPAAGIPGNVWQQASPLVMLADSAPAAALVLALPTALVDGHSMDYDKFRYRGLMPAAAVSCVLACSVWLLQFEPGVLRGLAAEPWGVLFRVVRDVCVVLASASAFNESWSVVQWAAYSLMQLASAILCWSPSSSSRCKATESSSRSSVVGGKAKQG